MIAVLYHYTQECGVALQIPSNVVFHMEIVLADKR